MLLFVSSSFGGLLFVSSSFEGLVLVSAPLTPKEEAIPKTLEELFPETSPGVSSIFSSLISSSSLVSSLSIT